MPTNRPCVPKRLPGAIFAVIAILLTAAIHAQSLTSDQVLIIFNKTDPESVKLAEFYREIRNVPASHLLGLDLSQEQDISRAEYKTSILAPLRAYMDEKSWWKRSKDAQGLILPVSNEIRCILLMRGIPLRITPDAATPTEQVDPQDPISPRDEASVDSELALAGIEGLPEKGVLRNTFFESAKPLSESAMPFLFLTCRIDAPTYATCKRMIEDSVATEKTGLWGRAYVDVANKIPEGDQWLNAIIAQNNASGIPTVTDRFNDTFPKNYPMTEASLYYGWYDWNVSGPFLNTGFSFRPGAIAVHIHSFSAQQLREPHQNWCAPLLVRGAAATVGNVYEPYLHLNHHFEILHDRLLKGWTFAEAAWAAMPVTSWQGIALGDPLYRPFLHFDGTGEALDADRDFRILRAASRQWRDDAPKHREKIVGAAEMLESGTLAEGLALASKEAGNIQEAGIWFNTAKKFFPDRRDKLRQDLQLISILREADKGNETIAALRLAKATYSLLPEAESLSGWLDILDPPPPPVADPTQAPQR